MLLPQFSHNKWLIRKNNKVAVKMKILILQVHNDNLIKLHNNNSKHKDLHKRVEIKIDNNKT